MPTANGAGADRRPWAGVRRWSERVTALRVLVAAALAVLAALVVAARLGMASSADVGVVEARTVLLEDHDRAQEKRLDWMVDALWNLSRGEPVRNPPPKE